jgi:hypothetical protein
MITIFSVMKWFDIMEHLYYGCCSVIYFTYLYHKFGMIKTVHSGQILLHSCTDPYLQRNYNSGLFTVTET